MSLRGGRSAPVARQILLLQLVVLVVVVLGSVGLAYSDARRDATRTATDQVVAVARTVGDSPVIDQAIRTSNPSEQLQPYAEQVRMDTGTDFVVIMTPEGIRWTHPDPGNIGKRFLGSIDRAQQGEPQTERYEGTLGPSIRAVVPVQRDGSIIALVSVGVIVEKVDAALVDALPQIVLAAAAVLIVGLLGAVLISRRLRRQTHGMGEREITRMYEYYDAVLQSVREGLLLLDRDHRIQLLNREGARLLGLETSVAGSRLDQVGLPPSLVTALQSDAAVTDEIHLVDTRMLVFNRRPAGGEDQNLGTVVTFRDHTEIRAMSGELDTVRGLAQSLRAQNHEAANRLHTVVSLIEMGRTDDAVTFATEELEAAQRLTDTVVESLDHPVVAALILGKMAQGAERGVRLVVEPGSYLRGMQLDPHDAVTVLGNLIDNAIDAAGETSPPHQVRIAVAIDAETFGVVVDDSGPGLSEEQRRLALQRGWSTKPSADGFGRGIGLALVVQIVRRHHGTVEISTSDLGGASFAVTVPTRTHAEAAR